MIIHFTDDNHARAFRAAFGDVKCDARAIKDGIEIRPRDLREFAATAEARGLTDCVVVRDVAARLKDDDGLFVEFRR